MKKGFTLMELIVVVIIVGILAMVGLPQFFQVAERGKAAEAFGILGTVRSGQIRYAAENNNQYEQSAACAGLDVNFTTPKYFAAPSCSTSGSGTMVRTGGYTLTINYATGNITCTAGGNITCPKMPTA